MDIDKSSLTSLFVQWNPLSNEQTGDSPILSYNLQVLSKGQWIDLKG